jgi:outer membrane murein-binding lipoprotein Lpp
MIEPKDANTSKWQTIHYLIYFALFAALALQMGLANRRYDETLSEYRALKAQYDQLEAQYPALKAQYEAQCSPLKVQYEKLESEYAQLKAQYDRIETQARTKAK